MIQSAVEKCQTCTVPEGRWVDYLIGRSLHLKLHTRPDKGEEGDKGMEYITKKTKAVVIGSVVGSTLLLVGQLPDFTA